MTIKTNAPVDFDGSDTLKYTMITISNSIIDVPVHGSSGRVDIIPKNRIILLKVPFLGHDIDSTARTMDWSVNGAI